MQVRRENRGLLNAVRAAPAQGLILRRVVKLVLLIGAAAMATMHLMVMPRTLQLRNAPVQLSESGGDALAVANALTAALKEVEGHQAQVKQGKIVPKFGEKAEAIMSKALAAAGGDSPELARALDGVLHSLFLQQLALVRKRVSEDHQYARAVDSLAKATREFNDKAKDLIMPGSSWSYDTECDEFSSTLEGNFRAAAALAEERARGVKTQQATIEAIDRLQKQIESAQAKAQAGRGGGGGWVLSTSYRIPKTPLQVVGKYQQGRAHIELNLTPDKDPVNAEAGFVEGVGPANLGLSFNLGV
mmetsp:Transcript_59721/g.142095  ORF Transcript_59721/g.142095 Transcript_59721/m.142095 type:complete len:302 (-) Transcript_59721:82-987(-)|eukprot:CAMPEP_0178408342 /NCGR_PEP_ID=MMETSP0689_2-20121128/19891_1 /TAXON_ID=160604 /ORGANISM="Amphidinium massartii, Strain CS-259" /LENGTH=301 /DNA_ID=CAMNT_0020029437 /DNA_START=232 /DNA_END=1137 /DNA_ORIENTATION=-